jgi:hypothetical protein
MMNGRNGEDDERIQGALNAGQADDKEGAGDLAQPEDAQSLGLDLGSILGALMGGAGGAQTGMPGQPGATGDMSQMGAQAGGLDLGALLGGLLGGGTPDAGSGRMPDQAGGMGTPFDGIIGSVAGDLSAKTGLPKEIITMGAMFLISKLMTGGLNNNQEGGQPGGLDLGALLGGLLGGGGMPGMGGAGMEQGLPQAAAGGINTPQEGEVLGKIGKQIGNSLNSPQLTTSGLQQNGFASEFAQMSGLSEDEAAQSLNQIVGALKQSGLNS